MIQPYAKIQNGVVINTQMCQSTDYMDPAFVWIMIVNVFCTDGSPVQIGSLYDGTNFTNPNQGN